MKGTKQMSLAKVAAKLTERTGYSIDEPTAKLLVSKHGEDADFTDDQIESARAQAAQRKTPISEAQDEYAARVAEAKHVARGEA